MSEEPKDVAKEFYHGMLKSKLNNMTNAALTIIEMTQGMVRHVPEPLFKQQVLPLVRGWVTGQPVEVGHWMNIADGMENEIIVVDADDKPLFTCPPPFIQILPRKEFGQRGQLAGHAILHMQGMMFDNGDVREAYEIDANLTELMTEKPDAALKTAALTQLIRIWMRYDLPLEELLGDKTQEVMAAYSKMQAAKGEAVPSSATKGNSSDDDEAEEELIY